MPNQGDQTAVFGVNYFFALTTTISPGQRQLPDVL
jgi:hypothetical protein